MAINFINANLNLTGTAKASGAEQSGKTAEHASSSAGSSTNGFSEILEALMVNRMHQNESARAASVTDEADKTVDLDEIFQKASDTYNVPVQLLKAVAKAESNFNPAAVSHAGAQGIMQLMPGTAKSLGVTDPFDPEQNIMGGAKYLSRQLERYDGNTVLALAAYNAGPGNVEKYGGVPPFKETQNYIAKVTGYANETIAAGRTGLPAQVPDNNHLNIAGLGAGLLPINNGDLDRKDYALLMELYRYRMQLSILSDSGSDTESDPFPSLV